MIYTWLAIVALVERSVTLHEAPLTCRHAMAVKGYTIPDHILYLIYPFYGMALTGTRSQLVVFWP